MCQAVEFNGNLRTKILNSNANVLLYCCNVSEKYRLSYTVNGVLIITQTEIFTL